MCVDRVRNCPRGYGHWLICSQYTETQCYAWARLLGAWGVWNPRLFLATRGICTKEVRNLGNRPPPNTLRLQLVYEAVGSFSCHQLITECIWGWNTKKFLIGCVQNSRTHGWLWKQMGSSDPQNIMHQILHNQTLLQNIIGQSLQTSVLEKGTWAPF